MPAVLLPPILRTHCPGPLRYAMCRGMACALLLIAVWGMLGAALPVQAQPDSVRVAQLRAQGYPPNHTPRRALWRAAALPGWGQVYNRQYLKLPFVYGGLAGLVYNTIRNQNRYRLYRRANQFAVGQQRAESEGGSNPFAQYEPQYNEVLVELGGGASANLIRQQRDAFQRQRNLMIIGTGAFYALTIVDAYVSAHLLTFDVGDELSVQVHPTLMPGEGLRGRRPAAGIQATWRFP